MNFFAKKKWTQYDLYFHWFLRTAVVPTFFPSLPWKTDFVSSLAYCLVFANEVISDTVFFVTGTACLIHF